MGDLRKEILRKTAGMPPPQFEYKIPKKEGKEAPTFEPLSWELFFDSQTRTEDGFLVYRAGPAATSSSNSNVRPYVFLLHGAGYTSLSWSLVAAELKQHVNVVAYDFRGHGGTQTLDSDEDFSLDTLSNDSVNVINQVVKSDLATMETEETPRVIIVGHSMGGGIAAKTASLLEKSWLKGLVLVDIVEGTALAALPSMHKIIASRPSTFKSISDAIYWSCRSRTVLNSYSARVSVPSQIVEQPNANGEGTCWKWRTNLLSTEPYWKEWYTGLSKLFLSITAPKILLIAGTDRLDQELTVGQMQGKFQMCLLPQAGHVIQEDAPVDTSQAILSFLKRQKLIEGDDKAIFGFGSPTPGKFPPK